MTVREDRSLKEDEHKDSLYHHRPHHHQEAGSENVALAELRRAYGDIAEFATLNPGQRKTLERWLSKYDRARLAQTIDWAANSGIEPYRAIQSINSALLKWKPEGGRGGERGRRGEREKGRWGDGENATDADEEYLRLNPEGPGREEAMERLQARAEETLR